MQNRTKSNATHIFIDLLRSTKKLVRRNFRAYHQNLVAKTKATTIQNNMREMYKITTKYFT
jgi:hypothetical protein